jgi:hypothetical protein
VPLFRTVKGRTGELTANPLLQSDVWRMIRPASRPRSAATPSGLATLRKADNGHQP